MHVLWALVFGGFASHYMGTGSYGMGTFAAVMVLISLAQLIAEGENVNERK